ncbi:MULTISPECIES: M13-type metalloendopeptidase [unclassified Pseudoxanthomonas]|uniref:M13 family metallopeptidase n=1 Tax=unclassified Pseudoxanthomonas TaxID=2645906 RepID=UPI00161D4E60|nr:MULTISPECIES: M13-type metalloendopeptidase [unclassified Pseudoxanthomonas]MBB3277541.1 putative endopeptidase [Pseudoxanthomonas sp. OG2]MBV7474213.1 peptidase [Pseudoxanthomonas sp. PXM05]UBB26217.1 peptidase [Pseudoxanthomonas japonensis]
MLLLSLAVTAALAGCSKPNEAASPDAAAKAGADSGELQLKLDESKLPPVNRFLVSDLDTSKNACADFTGYANGKWLAANAIPGDRTSWGAFEMLDERSTAVQRQLAEQAAAHANATGVEKIVGDLWATGMDEAKVNAQGIEPIKADLAAIDGLAGKEAIVEYLSANAAKGRNFLFGFGGEADFKDSSMVLAYASQGGLGLPDPEYYTKAENKEKLQAYEAHIAKVLELSGVAVADAAKQAKDVVAFETRLAKASKTSEELSRDVSLYYNPVTLADADKLTPNFSWTRFFESQGVKADKFSLAMPGFHQEVSKMLGDTDPAIWRAYLRFHTVDGASPYLSDAFVNENFNFYAKTLRGQKEIKPRWKRVLDTVEGEAGEALGQMYVKVAFPAESKAKMETLVGNLRTALKTRLENLPWMSAETKQKAIAKWETFTPKIGYPDKWREWTGLATSRDSYIGNVLAAQEFNYKWNLGKIGKPVDKTEWGMPPQMVNAYYNPLQNEIVFPAAILQPPFFDPNASDEMNYGGIGAVIGHEMIHGYDDQGSRFGPTGNMEVWWTDGDAKAFSGLTGKLVNQFNGYTTEGGGKVNGSLTLGENIADLGGLATAYEAMKKATEATPDPKTDGLTRDQRFFLNWATVWRRNFTPEELTVRLKTDPHAPANFRAIGAPSNLPAFAAAFQCKAGDAMVRDGDKQVVIW